MPKAIKSSAKFSKKTLLMIALPLVAIGVYLAITTFASTDNLLKNYSFEKPIVNDTDFIDNNHEAEVGNWIVDGANKDGHMARSTKFSHTGSRSLKATTGKEGSNDLATAHSVLQRVTATQEGCGYKFAVYAKVIKGSASLTMSYNTDARNTIGGGATEKGKWQKMELSIRAATIADKSLAVSIYMHPESEIYWDTATLTKVCT